MINLGASLRYAHGQAVRRSLRSVLRTSYAAPTILCAFSESFLVDSFPVPK